MKSGFLLLIACFQFCLASGQYPFRFTLALPDIDFITDVTELNDFFYFFSQNSSGVTAIITDNLGNPVHQAEILPNSRGFRILKTEGNLIYFVISSESDTCHSILQTYSYNIQSNEIHQLSSFPNCACSVNTLRIANGLNNGFLIYVDHYNYLTDDIEKNVFYLDSMLQWNLVFEDIYWGKCISIDFSNTGYVLCNTGLYDFYDSQFQFRKQRYNGDKLNSFYESFLPYGHGFMAEQSVQNSSTYPDHGLTIRIVDSNLYVLKKIAILPPTYSKGFLHISTPYHAGLDVGKAGDLWSAGTFYTSYSFTELGLTLDTAIYTVSKLDSNLSVICQHFLGYDTHYRINGINALPSGGAILYGARVRDGLKVNQGEDSYALRFGEDCELPQTSVFSIDQLPSLISVYPNPTINSLTFEVYGFDPALLQVEIFNSAGVTLFAQKDLSYEIHVPHLPAGQYFYRILKGTQVLGAGAWVKE